MKILLAAALALAIASTGCIFAPPGHRTSSGPVYGAPPPAENCPPGHRWSDGRCHAKGKGHDPAKHGG